MTRKDYKIIARAIKDVRIRYGDGILLEKLVEQLCLELKDDNINFKADKFTEACRDTQNLVG